MFTNAQIDVDALPKIEDVSLTRISPRYFNVLLINFLLVYLTIIVSVLIIKLGFYDEFLQPVFWYIFAAFVVISILNFILLKLAFPKRKYALREKDIIYSSGYFTNKTTTLPFSRIQHIEVSRSFLSRKFGLSSLKIYSAGESGGDISIAGLPKSVADTQYAFLTTIVNERS